MKKLTSLSCCLFLLISLKCFTQNVNYEVQVVGLRTNIMSDGIFGGPDPSWKVWANDDIDNVWTGGNCIYRDDVTPVPYTIDTTDPSGELPYNIRSVSNTSATQINLRFYGFEKDCAWFGVTERCTYDGCCDQPFCFLADEFLAQTTSLASIDYKIAPQCQWNYYGWYSCGDFEVQIRIRWEIANPPLILVHPSEPSADTVLCAPTPLLISVIADTSAIFYQWQLNSNTSLNPANGWTDIAGANSSTYTVPIINGTRNYRVLVSSGCIPGFINTSAISQSIRVTYQPYPASPILSSVCGSMVLPNSTHNFSTVQEPDSNAIVHAIYNWSGSIGLVFHTPHTNNTNVTFPSYGLYQIQLEYEDSCTGTNTIAPLCQVIVGSSHCDFVYVSPNGVDTSVAGTPAEPVKTLAYALTMANGSRNTIRMEGGIYNETSVIHMKDDITIDGGYVVNNNNWIKSSAQTTIINIDAPLETTEIGGVPLGYYRGIAAQNVNNWTLQDLYLNVKINGAFGTTSRSGHSVYGIHITDSCFGYLISRCQLEAGPASAGENGLPGFDGIVGNNGFNGIAGGETHNGVLDCDLDANGHGGIGADSVGNGIRMGGAGGNGGRGGYDEFSLFCSGETGFIGEDGGNGNTPGGANAGTGGHRASACIPGDAVVGETGQDGLDGISYLIPATTNYDYSNFIWVPAYGLNGGDGYGGGGGQGGGGSSGQGTGVLPFCLPGRGNGGGGGGSGGEGATGGQGGGGGGSSFGIYVSGTGTGTITSSIVVVPNTSPALGGTGFTGGIGGNGGIGGLGDANCQSENGAGADGGTGGKGGDGGKGQDGAQGVIIPIAVGGTAILNGSSTAIPHPTEISVNYNNFRGCTYSEIEMSKLDGLWTLPVNGHLVNDINPLTSSFDFTSDSIVTYFDSTGTYTLGANNGNFDSFVRITDDRILPQIIVNSSPACFDSIIYLTSDLLALEYEWLVYTVHPDSFVFFSNLPAPQLSGFDEGVYIVRLKQRDVCCGWSIPVFSTLIVLPELAPGIIGNTDTICYGAIPNILVNIQTASGGTGSMPQYQWQMSTTSDTAGVGQWTDIFGAHGESYQPTNLFETTHFVRQFSDSCGMKYSNVITVVVLPELQGGTIGTDTILCENSIPDSFLSIDDASGGSGSTVNYQWYYSTTTNIPGTTGWNSIISATANTYQAGALTQTSYFVREATDSCNTVYSNVVTVYVDSIPYVDAGIPQDLCGLLDFTLNAVLITGNGLWYQSAGPGNSVFTPNNQAAQADVHVDQYGNYEYTWVVTNGVCLDSATTTVVLHPNLTLSVSPSDTTMCEGDSIILQVSGGVYYLWQPSLSLSSDTGQSVNAYPLTTTQYLITATDNNACTGSAFINVQVDNIPIADAGNDIELCGLLAFGLHATTNTGSGSWQLVSGTGSAVYNPSNQVTEPTVSVDLYGHYIFLWTAISGICSDTSSVVVNLHPNPVISVQPQNPSVCEGSSITLMASGAETYLWTPATYLSTTAGDVVTATPNNDITYNVNGTSDLGCSSSVNISIIVHEYPIVNLGDSLYFCSSPDIVIDAGGGYQHYIWQDGSTNSTIQVTQAGTYWVIVDNHGCLTTDSIEIKPCIDIVLPNVFTPNGDGINDLFYAEGNFLEYFNISILNRWGKVVFEARDISACWDGTINGIEATEGTYYWIVNYKSKSYLTKDKEIQLKGWLNLLR